MCDWECGSGSRSVSSPASSFNPWKGLCVIESLSAGGWFAKTWLFQSLKGIMCDWETLINKVPAPGREFQSLKGIMCDWEKSFWSLSMSNPSFNPWKGLCVIESSQYYYCFEEYVKSVSIPERDYVWLRGFSFWMGQHCTTFQSLKGIMCDWEALKAIQVYHGMGWFQSLKGIMCDWEINNPCDATSPEFVSIPERDYVWLRAECPDRFFREICSRFNPWKGLCVIEICGSSQQVSMERGFNPWKGLCVIEIEDKQKQNQRRRGAEFQSLKGIMCDWDSNGNFLETSLTSFNPWKGLCVIEMQHWILPPNLITCFNPWKGLCVIEIAETWNA